MLTLNITPLLQARQIERPYTFLVKAGISPRCASRLIANEMRTVRLDHIEILCRELHCQPNDIIVYSPSKNKILAETHPLHKLMAKEINFDWQQSLKTMPLEHLKEISKLISTQNEAQ